MSELWRRLLHWLHRDRFDHDLEEEMRFHLEMKAAEQGEHGARRQFGNVTLLREVAREAWSWQWLDALAADVRFGVRSLRHNPGFTVVAVLTLTLGIGVNTAIYSLLDQAMFQRLPVDDPEQLVVLRSPGPSPGMYWNSGRAMSFSYPMYQDIHDHNEVFAGLAAKFTLTANLVHEDVAEGVSAELISGDYFQLLGVRPALGRLITPDDDRSLMGHPVAVLSHEFWMRCFGGDPSIIGRRVTINNQIMTVIGVSARGFHGLEIGTPVDVRIPMMMKDALTPTWPGGFEQRRQSWLNIVGRLRPELSREEAEAGIGVLYRQILAEEAKELTGRWAAVREEFANRELVLVPLARGIRWWAADGIAETVVPLMAIAGLVLLIACVNLASLLLARNEARRRELMIRLALGAGRARVGRQLVLEGLLLAMAGGSFGFLLAWAAGRPVAAMLLTEEVARAFDVTPDFRLLLFTFVVSLVTVMFFCAGPAIRPLKGSLTNSLKSGAGGSEGTSATRLRRALVSAQVALCLWLLFGAGLFVHTLTNLNALDRGFEKENLLSFSVDLYLSGYDLEQSQDVVRRIEDRIRALPGVSSVAYSNHQLLSGGFNTMLLEIEGFEARTPEETYVRQIMVSRDYRRTVGLQLVSGRDLTAVDEDRRRTAIVNEEFAKRFFGGENPVGKHLQYAVEPSVILEVVGLVRNESNLLARAQPLPILYVPNVHGGATFHVRGEQRIAPMIPAIRNAVRDEAPNVPLHDLATMEARLDEVLHTENVIAGLLLVFGSLAVALAAVGLYGVMAYTVTRRKREIGIRMAIGAERSNVVWLIMRQAAVTVALGLVVGLPSGLAAVRLVEGYLFGVEPADPAAIAATLAVLSGAGTVAGLLPAVRAARIDPASTLRSE